MKYYVVATERDGALFAKIDNEYKLLNYNHKLPNYWSPDVFTWDSWALSTSRKFRKTTLNEMLQRNNWYAKEVMIYYIKHLKDTFYKEILSN
jgi:hypothetical protein